MTSSLKTGLECKHCARHSPATTVAKQWGENKGNNIASIDHVALKVNGAFICCKCGTKIGVDNDYEMPSRVGEILGFLLQDCLFQIDSVTDQSVGQPFIWLTNRALPGFRCQLRWFRDERYRLENGKSRHPVPDQDFDVSELRERPPALAEHALRVLSEKGLKLTELPKGSQGYAYLMDVIRGYDKPMEEPLDPADFDPDNPSAPENVSDPLVVYVHLQWQGALKS